MQHKIEITLQHYDLGSSAARTAANKAFGLDVNQLRDHYMWGSSVTVLATLEQFGLFVTLRNDMGGTNLIKALKPKLIAPPPPLPARVDVTQYQLSI